MSNPLVGIVMGSESDLDIMKAAAEILRQFEVEPELTIVSAHRTPERLREYATKAKERGLKVIIAGAGGAAHLPGMIAAQTILPVIGVPVNLATVLMGGIPYSLFYKCLMAYPLQLLLSTVQKMPVFSLHKF